MKETESQYMMRLEEAVAALNESCGEEMHDKVAEALDAVRVAMKHGEKFIVPVEFLPSDSGRHETKRMQGRDSESLPFQKLTVRLRSGRNAFAVFTCREELLKGAEADSITVDMESFLQEVIMEPDIAGVVINPWDNDFYISKEYVELIFEADVHARRENVVSFDTADLESYETVDIVHSTDAVVLRNRYWDALETARKNDIHAIAFPAISAEDGGYPIENMAEIALKTVCDWSKINSHYGMTITFVSSDEQVTSLYRSIWHDNNDAWSQYPIVRENNGMLEEAIRFAMEAHAGSCRKGTDRPYILHPLESLQILASMDADTNLMIAGVLHDTLEDTEVTLFDIYDRFGADVAALVNSHTEDKRRSWYMRKLVTVTELPQESLRQKMLVIADKVANMRNMWSDYRRIGEDFWERFNAPRELQAWYYSKLNDGLYELQDHAETADVYWEMTGLYKDLFVAYFIDDDRGRLYQISADGARVVLDKGKPQWKELDGELPKTARLIERRDVERIADTWAEPFWAVHERDLVDGVYELYSSDRCSLTACLSEGTFALQSDRSGETVYCQALDGFNTHRFLVQLRLKHGIRSKLSTVLKKEFGREDGVIRFRDYCEEHGIKADD